MPKFVCHDVFQRSPRTAVQKRAVRCQGKLDEIFLKVMKPFEGVEVVLAGLGEGLETETSVVRYVREHPEWIVQNHGYRHVRYDALAEDDFRRDLAKTADLIEIRFGKRPTEYYPPWNQYNDMTRRVAEELGMSQQEQYRKVNHYCKDWSKCAILDFHYWSYMHMPTALFVLRYFHVEPHFIVGAPRSGTTALMRFYAKDGGLVIKEAESVWKNKADLREFYAKRLVKSDGRAVIDKNVRNSFRLDELSAEFPQARFTHIIRDGRAAISSWRDWAVKTGKQDQSIIGAARQWRDYVEHVLAYKSKLPNYKEVRYEELCHTYSYFRSRNNKWRERLSRAELDDIMQIAGPLLKQLGYV